MGSTSFQGSIRTTHKHQLYHKLFLVLVQLLSIPVLLSILPIEQSQASIIYPNSALIPSSSSVWTSSNGVFSMGFFSFLPSAYYVGIWYTSLPLNQSILWTANRNQSAPTNSTLRFTADGKLQLTIPSSNSSDASGLIIWEASSLSSPNANASQAELLDSGNFVVRDAASEILWQSFDHPTDTLLPSQNFTFLSNPSLVPWASINDPSPSSKYSLVFGRIGGPLAHIRLLYQNTDEYWSEPPPEVATALSNTTINIDATGTFSLYNGDGSLIWQNTSCDNGISSSLTKLQLSVDGNLRVLTWSTASTTWDTRWRALYLQCDVFGTCGDNAICDKNQNLVSVGGGGCPEPEADLESTLCSCPQGFTRRDSNCAPPSSLNCSQYTSRVEHTSFGTSDTEADYNPITLEVCLDRCVDDCNCTAASYDNTSSACWLYHGSLFNGLRFDQINRTSFIKTIDTSLQSDGVSLPAYAIALIVVAGFLILLLTSAGLIIRHQFKLRHPTFKPVLLDLDMLDALGGPKQFSFKDLYMVTRGFHDENNLGAGGFGSVYKGTFTTPHHGKLDVAVKRLNKFPRQGIQMDQGKEHNGFLAEIETLGSIKHLNVVNLMGFCAEGPERLLVYEYVANGSLAKHILNESSILSWDLRFQIAVGAATGIEYLHAHCPKKIVHRDIKPDNILLDEEFKAKVADFGISKIMGPERTHLTNNTLRGTPTYMAPECWQVGALLTEKADAYSYGLVLLELVSGRRVTKEHYVVVEEEGKHYAEIKEGDGEQDRFSIQERVTKNEKSIRRMLSLEHARNEMEKKRWESLVDERLEAVYEREDAERLLKIVFWCLQGNPEHRPAMEDLVLMIKGLKAVPQPPLLGLFDHPFAGVDRNFDTSLGSSSQPTTLVLPDNLSQGR